MAKITRNALKEKLEYNPTTGIFKWKVSDSPRVNVGDIAGCSENGYISIQIEGKAYKAHVLAWFYYYGYWVENEIDHEDQVKHHNWIDNLREVSHQCNMRNTGNSKANTSGVKGVGFSKSVSKWVAAISIKGKQKYLGAYEDFDNAVCARLAGEQCLNWAGCDNNSPAYLYVQTEIQGGRY